MKSFSTSCNRKVTVDKQIGDEQGCSVPFDGRVGRHHDFAHPLLANAADERVDRQVLRSDSFQGRNPSLENVISSVKNRRSFERQHILRLFDNADEILLATGIAANVAQITVGQVEATLTGANLLFDVGDGVSQIKRFPFRTGNDVIRQSLSRFATDPGEGSKLFDQPADGRSIRMRYLMYTLCHSSQVFRSSLVLGRNASGAVTATLHTESRQVLFEPHLRQRVSHSGEIQSTGHF